MMQSVFLGLRGPLMLRLHQTPRWKDLFFGFRQVHEVPQVLISYNQRQALCTNRALFKHSEQDGKGDGKEITDAPQKETPVKVKLTNDDAKKTFEVQETKTSAGTGGGGEIRSGTRSRSLSPFTQAKLALTPPVAVTRRREISTSVPLPQDAEGKKGAREKLRSAAKRKGGGRKKSGSSPVKGQGTGRPGLPNKDVKYRRRSAMVKKGTRKGDVTAKPTFQQQLKKFLPLAAAGVAATGVLYLMYWTYSWLRGGGKASTPTPGAPSGSAAPAGAGAAPSMPSGGPGGVLTGLPPPGCKEMPPGFTELPVGPIIICPMDSPGGGIDEHSIKKVADNGESSSLLGALKETIGYKTEEECAKEYAHMREEWMRAERERRLAQAQKQLEECKRDAEKLQKLADESKYDAEKKQAEPQKQQDECTAVQEKST